MKLLYKTPIDESAQPSEQGSEAAELAESGVLEGDESLVAQLSSNPSEITLQGRFQYGAPFAKMIAGELEELSKSALDTLPVFRPGDREWEGRGYYEISASNTTPVHPNSDDVYEYEVTLSKEGTRATRFRAVRTNPRQAEHEFGNDLEALVAAPASARKARWMHPVTKATSRATPIATRPGEFGDVDVYDLSDAPWYDPPPWGDDPPVLIYDAPYDVEAPVDCRIYDTRGEDDKYVEDGDNRARQWQSVYLTSHDPVGDVVLENGLLRIRLDEDAGTLEAEEWDDVAEEWTDVGLSQPADVELYDVDLAHISMALDRAQLTFDVDGDLVALDVSLARGEDAVLVELPEGETGPIPDALEDWLAPIAAETVIDAQPAKTLVSRSEVRK